MSLSSTSRPGQDSRSHTAQFSDARDPSATRQWTAVFLICCLATNAVSERLVRGQAKSPPRRVSREPIPDTTMTTPQAASPNADYALSSILSRTAAPTNVNDANVEINNILARRLWQNRITALDPNEDAEIRNDLRSLIRQVRSLTFEDTTTDPTFSTFLEPTPGTDNATTNAVSRVNPKQTQPPATTTAPAPEPLTALPTDTLKELEDLLRDPDQVGDPLEMAELLFLSGRPSEAAVFYEKALALVPRNDPTTSEDRAWILFQLGNCLRPTDMTKARDMYMKLISQYPSSPWTELAKVHGRLITWYQSAKPEQLMPKDE